MRCDLATWHMHLIWVAQQMLTKICQEDYSIPHHEQGGYLCAMQASNQFLVLHCAIGRTHPEKRDSFYRASLRGVNYLLHNHHHQTSLQGHDPQAGIWGGSIRAGNWAIGFNGLTELNNEALVIGLAYFTSLIDRRSAENLALISNNTTALKLIDGRALLVLPQLPFIS